jgi:hypothetical protein
MLLLLEAGAEQGSCTSQKKAAQTPLPKAYYKQGEFSFARLEGLLVYHSPKKPEPKFSVGKFKGQLARVT